MTPVLATEMNQQVVSALKTRFLCQHAEKTLSPQLDEAINETAAAAESPRLSPDKLASIYETSARALQRVKEFSLAIDDIDSKLPQSAEGIVGKANLLSTEMNRFVGSEVHDATIDLVNEDDTALGGRIVAAMDQYEDEAEQALGVVNFSRMEKISKEVEDLLAKPDVSEEEIAAIFQKARQASKIIRGAEKATSYGILDESKVAEGTLRNRLKNRAKKARDNLQNVTLAVIQTENGKLCTVVQSIEEIIADKAASVEFEKRRVEQYELLIGSDPERQNFVTIAQRVYENSKVPDSIRRGLQETVIRTLKLWSEINVVRSREGCEDKVETIAKHAFAILALYMNVAYGYFHVFREANLAIRKDKTRIPDVKSSTNQRLSEELIDAGTLYKVIINRSWDPYVALHESALVSIGGKDIYAQYHEEHQKCLETDEKVKGALKEYNSSL